MPLDAAPLRSASMRTWSFVPSLALALLGCPADDVTNADASGGHGSTTSPAGTTSDASGTGSIPPPTSSSSSGSDGLDSTASTTTNTTSDDLGASDDVSGCDDTAVCCGNGIIDDTEQCDCGGLPCTPAGLDFAECAGLFSPQFPDRVYTGGILDCSPASCQYVFTTCTFCGDGQVNGNENCEPDPPPEDSCASLGLGPATEPLPCDESCQLDTSSCGRGMGR